MATPRDADSLVSVFPTGGGLAQMQIDRLDSAGLRLVMV